MLVSHINIRCCAAQIMPVYASQEDKHVYNGYSISHCMTRDLAKN